MKIKTLLYCAKAKKQKDLLWSNNLKHFFLDGAYNRLIDNLPEYLLNGKIVAECDFEVEEIDTMALSEHTYDDYYNDNIDRISKESCLTCEQMCKYLGTTWDSIGYAIHIKNLHIFDKSISLNQLKDRNMNIVKNAPQNMMYINCIETGNKVDLTDKILISIKPQEMCRIANKEQTILVRKRVLKEMLEDE